MLFVLRKLEKVAIDDVSPFKVAWQNAIANLESRDTSDLISMVSFTFDMRRYLFAHAP